MRSSRGPRYPKHVLSGEREINPEILQAARGDLRIYVPPREEDPAGGTYTLQLAQRDELSPACRSRRGITWVTRVKYNANLEQ